jgi:hypothetical protein
VEVLVVLATVLAVAVLLLLATGVRRRLLQRGGSGTVDCSLRLRDGRDGRGWALGVGRYGEHRLRWYRVFSLSPLPRRSYDRRGLSVLSRREPTSEESLSLLSGSVVVECATGDSDGGRVEIGLPRESLTAFLAWLESAPPGSGPYPRSR